MQTCSPMPCRCAFSANSSFALLTHPRYTCAQLRVNLDTYSIFSSKVAQHSHLMLHLEESSGETLVA